MLDLIGKLLEWDNLICTFIHLVMQPKLLSCVTPLFLELKLEIETGQCLLFEININF